MINIFENLQLLKTFIHLNFDFLIKNKKVTTLCFFYSFNKDKFRFIVLLIGFKNKFFYSCVQFALEPILLKDQPQSFGCIKRLAETIKRTSSKISPSNKELNEVSYIFKVKNAW